MLKQIIIMFLFCSTAWSMPIETTPIGRAYNDGWWYPAGSAYIGPGNRGGTALGFRLSEGYRLTVLKGFIDGIGDPGGYGYVAMSLHRGSRFGHDNVGPLPSNDIIFSSERNVVDFNADIITHSYETNLELEAGDYWVAFQGGSPNVGSMRARDYALEGEKMAGVHAPEPMTLLLMAGGILGAIRMRRKI